MLNCNEIYDRGGKSTNIFKEHLILRKEVKVDSIIENLKEKLIDFNITKLNKKEIFIEPIISLPIKPRSVRSFSTKSLIFLCTFSWSLILYNNKTLLVLSAQ